MSRLLIFLFLLCFGYIVYYVINLLIRQRLTEGFISAASGDPLYFMDETEQPINDVALNDRDSHFFLMNAILPGKVDISNLKETNHNHTSYYYIDDEGLTTEMTDPNVVKHRESKLNYPKIKDKLTCIKEDNPLLPVIQKYQPYIYDQPHIINYYDQALYRDFRYGEQPISLKFAANPEKYCEQYPNVYPCFKYYSKW
jgi:hypothetical protein